MRFAFQLIFIAILTFPEIACVHRAHLAEGVVCFRNQHYRDAFIYLKPEAEKGQPDAQYAVGYMYYYGQGVTEDKRQAWIWINRAASKGQPDAIQAIHILKCQPRTKTRDPLDALIHEPEK